jgi:hypothetical protein
MWDEARKDAYSTVLPYIPHGNLVTRNSGPPTAIPHPAIALPEPIDEQKPSQEILLEFSFTSRLNYGKYSESFFAYILRVLLYEAKPLYNKLWWLREGQFYPIGISPSIGSRHAV